MDDIQYKAVPTLLLPQHEKRSVEIKASYYMNFQMPVAIYIDQGSVAEALSVTFIYVHI